MKKSTKKQKKRLKKKNKVPAPHKLRKMIAADILRYLDILGMNHYRTKIFYMKFDTEDNTCPGNSTVAAAATADMRYLNVHIKIYPWLVNQWKKKLLNDEDIHEIIAHEISHVATTHMYRLVVSVFKDEGEVKDAFESLTTIIGRLVNEIDRYRKKNKKSA